MDVQRKKNIELPGIISTVLLNFELTSKQFCSHQFLCKLNK